MDAGVAEIQVFKDSVLNDFGEHRTTIANNIQGLKESVNCECPALKETIEQHHGTVEQRLITVEESTGQIGPDFERLNQFHDCFLRSNVTAETIHKLKRKCDRVDKEVTELELDKLGLETTMGLNEGTTRNNLVYVEANIQTFTTIVEENRMSATGGVGELWLIY